MIQTLRNIISDIKLIDDENETSSQCLYALFSGIGNELETKTLYAKYFNDPKDIYNKLEDCENIEILEISDDRLSVLTFSDGYDGYLLNFKLHNGKLFLSSSTKIVDERDPIYDEDGLDYEEIDNIL